MKKILIRLFNCFLTITVVLLSCESSPEKNVLIELEFTKKLTFDTPNFEEAKLNLQKNKELEFWSQLDIEFKENPEMIYLVEIWKENRKMGGFELNALKVNPVLFNLKQESFSKTHWKFTGKMDFLKIQEKGTYLFKFVLYCSDPTIKCNVAKLIIK